jgi:hypothetical protein
MKSENYNFKFLENFLIDIIEKKKLYDKYFLSWILLKNGKNDFSFIIQEQLGNFYLIYDEKRIPLIVNNQNFCSYSCLNKNKDLLDLIFKSLTTNQMSSALEIDMPFYGKYKFRYSTFLNQMQNSTINFRSIVKSNDSEPFIETLIFVLNHYFDGRPFSKEEMEFFNEEYHKLTGEYVDFNQDFKQYINLLEDIIKINRIVNY